MKCCIYVHSGEMFVVIKRQTCNSVQTVYTVAVFCVALEVTHIFSDHLTAYFLLVYYSKSHCTANMKFKRSHWDLFFFLQLGMAELDN